jgi:Ca2+-binding RTX toxin-like protein
LTTTIDLVMPRGNDALNGGNGIDTTSYSTASSGVVVDLSVVRQQNTIGAGLDTLTSIENLTGSGWADTKIGNAIANVLNGGAGAVTLTGNGVGDTFVSADNFGNEVATVFEVGQNVLELQVLFADTAAVLAATADNVDGDAVIAAGSDTIALVGVHRAQLSASDFHLV